MLVHTLVAALLAATPAGKEPTPEEILSRYDQVMGPERFESEATMTAHREDGTTRTYLMRFLKGEGDKFRVWFKEPSSVKGQEILRVGDNLWLYLPNLKRATRIANRDNFQGGDFNNADVLRVNYTQDYTAVLAPSEIADTFLLDLKAKNNSTAYETIKLWVRKKDFMPVQGQYFGTSGQMLRSAAFFDYQEFDKGYVRPGKVVMRNELLKERYSEMETRTMKVNVEAPAQRFVQTDLGR